MCSQFSLFFKASTIPGQTHSFFHNFRNPVKIIEITIPLNYSPLFFSFPQTLPCTSLPPLSQFITSFTLIVVMHITHSWMYKYNLLDPDNVVVYILFQVRLTQELDNQIMCSSLGKNGYSSFSIPLLPVTPQFYLFLQWRFYQC